MYARSTLENYAAKISNAEERESFQSAIAGIQVRTREGIELIFDEDMTAAGLQAHVECLEDKKMWLFLTSFGGQLEALYAARHKAGKA